MSKLLMTTLVIAGGLLAFVLITENDNFLTRTLIVVLFSAIILIPIAPIFGKYRSNQKYPNFWKLRANGLLEWDLRENGIVAKVYSLETVSELDISKNLTVKFILFSEISKVIIFPEKEKADEVYRLLMQAQREKSPEKAVVDKGPGWGTMFAISNRIWLIDIDGKLMDHALYRMAFKWSTMPKFIEILRSKVKVVE